MQKDFETLSDASAAQQIPRFIADKHRCINLISCEKIFSPVWIEMLMKLFNGDITAQAQFGAGIMRIYWDNLWAGRQDQGWFI